MKDDRLPTEEKEDLQNEQAEKVQGGEENEQNKQAEQKSGKSAEEELQQKKLICALAYIFGLLFFLPLILYPNDDFARFHANQSLAVLLCAVIGEAVFGILSAVLGGVAVLGTLFGIVCGVFGLVILIACIAAIVGVVRGEKYSLPVIGQFKILK